ncbi:MAG TPA: hypothetical protein VGU02_09675 [Gaiellaceae bacterium]|nr:hypothetical protein [Gaiellaceae bacterium]
MRIALVAVGFVVVFLVGIGLGEALHDNPSGAGMQTIVRTLSPLPLAPAARTTVTVTTSSP